MDLNELLTPETPDEPPEQSLWDALAGNIHWPTNSNGKPPVAMWDGYHVHVLSVLYAQTVRTGKAWEGFVALIAIPSIFVTHSTNGSDAISNKASGIANNGAGLMIVPASEISGLNFNADVGNPEEWGGVNGG